MKIIIDYRNTYKGHAALRTFTEEFWRDITIQHPHHDFVFITAHKTLMDQAGKNAHCQQLRKTRLKWLDRIRLKKLLASLKADRLVTLNNSPFGIGIHTPHGQNNTIALAPAKKLVFAAGGAEDNPAVANIAPALPDVITVLSWAETESIKTEYTGGRGFFLFSGDIGEQHQLIELLKAFSVFKKWQQSNMQLVIAGSATAWTDTLEEKLLTYKYREDVVLLKKNSTTITAKLVAACYAMVYPVSAPVFPMALLWAVQSHKAIIATSTGYNRQLTTAAAWVEPDQVAEGFAKAMILLYKDENQQQQLVQQAKEQAGQFNRPHMLAAAWAHIEQ